MVITSKISLQTKGNGDSIDITSQIQDEIDSNNINSGTVTVFVSGSTAGLTTIEYEPGVVSDFEEMFERIIPKGMKYEHDRAWGDGNGHSHVRASLLGPSLVIPFSDKRLILGTWQQVILVDFDNRPRSRQVILQIMGE
ncbi:MAG: YjbQ family protein [Dehalococcoidales bacterium]|nr:MAG: YjbQ family protein [Dehalococcoidales bacterium]